MDALSADFVRILTALLDAPSPPGCEERLAAVVRKELDSIGYKHETDAAGNVISRIGGGPGSGGTIFAAHMDEISMTVTAIGADGALKVAPLGGMIPCKLGESAVSILSDRGETVSGIFSMGSTHRKGTLAGEWTPGWQDVRVITGISPEQLRRAGVRVGSPIVPARDGRGPHVFGDVDDPMLAAWTLDDRAGIAELLLVLKELKAAGFTPRSPLMFAFTVHEEGNCFGSHGAKVLAARERPDVFIAVDGCPVLEPDGLKLDGRPAAWSCDTFCNYTQALLRDFISAAERAGTELQVAVYERAASDASAVYNAGLAPQFGLLGHVRTNSHGFEVARLSVFGNAVRTITEYILKQAPTD